MLRNRGRRAKRDADKAAARAGACQTVPGLAGALESGKVSAGHVDAIANASAGLDDTGKEQLAEHADKLIESASKLPVERFGREVRDLADILTRHPVSRVNNSCDGSAR